MRTPANAKPWEEGDPQSKLLVLGEAPAVVEFRMGKPLVGPSGDVFKDCLHQSGLVRQQCYILNLWRCFVRKDKLGSMFDQDAKEMLYHYKMGITSYGAEQAEKTLEKIRKSGANVVLALGQAATDALMGKKKPIGKWRGSILWSDVVQKKYVPTFHPAFSLHGNYASRYLIIADMQKVAGKSRIETPHPGEMDYPELKLPEREIIIAPTFKQVIEYMEECGNRKKFATDLEVMNDHVSCFSLSYDPASALVVPLRADGGTDYFAPEEEELVWRYYASLMGDPGIMKVNQNIIGFDVPFLFQQCNIITRGRLLDTMVAQHIMYPDLSKGLDMICSLYTREPYYKDEGKIWKNPDIDWSTFQRYCGKDACVALESWDVLSTELTAGDYWPTYNRTARLAHPLTYMSARGLAIRKEDLAAMNIKVEAQLLSKKEELKAIAEWDFLPTSPQQCFKYFYETKGIKPYIGRTGRPTTDDTAMSRIVRRAIDGSKEAKLVQEIRALTKLKTTYLEVDLDKDGRLRCSWNPRGTWTGRLSSSETLRGTGMNLQNIHPDFKGFISAG